MKVLFQADLDKITANGCETPGCKHEHDGVLYLNARCHPYSAVSVRYQFGTGILEIVCKECGLPVADISVTPTLPATKQNTRGN
jgi:hypothetical protein